MSRGDPGCTCRYEGEGEWSTCDRCRLEARVEQLEAENEKLRASNAELRRCAVAEPPPWIELWDALERAGWCLFADVPGEVRAYRRLDGDTERVLIPTGPGPHSQDNAIAELRKVGLVWPAPKDRPGSVNEGGDDYWTEQFARDFFGERGRMYQPHLGAWQTTFSPHDDSFLTYVVSVDGSLDVSRATCLRNRLDIWLQAGASYRRHATCKPDLQARAAELFGIPEELGAGGVP